MKTNRRFVITAFSAFTASLIFAGCSQKQTQLTANTTQNSPQKEVIKVGVTGIVSQDILKFVNDKLAAKEGLEVKVVNFNDWIQPNTALRDQVMEGHAPGDFCLRHPTQKQNSKFKKLMKCTSYLF